MVLWWSGDTDRWSGHDAHSPHEGGCLSPLCVVVGKEGSAHAQKSQVNERKVEKSTKDISYKFAGCKDSFVGMWF